MASLQVGDTAPAFSLPDQNSRTHSLADYQGSWVLLYFYPKDDTPGCTTEACSIRDHFAGFSDARVTVLGVSKDSAASHKKFEEKYQLPFTLLSDPDTAVISAYGAWGTKTFAGSTSEGTLRMSYLIDPQGRVAKIYKTVKPPEHAEQVLSDIKALQG